MKPASSALLIFDRKILIVFSFDFKIRTGMAAYGANLGSLRAILEMSAVSAIPNLDIFTLENLAV